MLFCHVAHQDEGSVEWQGIGAITHPEKSKRYVCGVRNNTSRAGTSNTCHYTPLFRIRSYQEVAITRHCAETRARWGACYMTKHLQRGPQIFNSSRARQKAS